LTVQATDSLEYFDHDKRAVATGHAHAQKESRSLAGDWLQATMTQDSSGKIILRRIEAKHNVIVSTGKEVGMSQFATYDDLTKIAILENDVRLQHKQGLMTGDRAQMNLQTGVSSLLAEP